MQNPIMYYILFFCVLFVAAFFVSVYERALLFFGLCRTQRLKALLPIVYVNMCAWIHANPILLSIWYGIYVQVFSMLLRRVFFLRTSLVPFLFAFVVFVSFDFFFIRSFLCLHCQRIRFCFSSADIFFFGALCALLTGFFTFPLTQH